MKTKEFDHVLDHAQIVAAITKAEEGTSAEIRVFVSQKKTEDALKQAKAEFHRLGMEKTADRNGILLFIAPESQKFALIGDEGIHAKCGQSFWEEVTASISTDFRQGDFTKGIVTGVQKAGELLRRHFPRKPGDKNELTDDVARD
ncbi:MAG: hypothetical protein K0Q55_2707 [Verrucomicrobia bacterium]|jgi:uncharacterized membrane protein|nr:hypothetical protein [Verrucomicrobiota bacterium]